MGREKATDITDISELPDLPWEEYEKVDEATRRTATWWYNEISERSDRAIGRPPPNESSEYIPTKHHALIGNHPVHSLTHIEQYVFHKDADFSKIDEIVSDWQRLMRKSNIPSKVVEQIVWALLPAHCPPDWDISSILNEPYSYQGSISPYLNQVNVVVDLDAPDNLIIESFCQWLSQVRKSADNGSRENKKPPKFFSKADFDKWYENRILLLIDLKNWASDNNKHIPNRFLGDVLFFDDYRRDRTELIRKTVNPMAKKVLSGTTLRALRLQACTEQAETS